VSVIDRETIEHVAMLARLVLSDEEKDRLARDLTSILDDFARLGEVDTDGLAPMEHAAATANVFRPDEPAGSLPTDRALAASADHDEAFFRVPQVIE
jgi:aspartyl-tRNA(Asn)/glutamyl-tRNA(Gln) amidotransferase subunit C